ncbi:hypothetical protein [Streptomyces sp. 1331.2]|uniref:hypothetical protein n=1 Tax=Streptomyces sp. 1331.2 TaxID=1938835 RepID=UPI000BD324BC|nr:hypothetical protein [Streptomyces sp. 1331.2]SOB82559.1 hypothetical protein SAMN06272789_2729 [Streptomyces sp. 1331.2]
MADTHGDSERETGQVEAFAAFLAGLLAAGLTVLVLLGGSWLMNADELTAPSRPWIPTALKALVAAVWPATTVLVYLRLKRRRRGRA